MGTFGFYSKDPHQPGKRGMNVGAGSMCGGAAAERYKKFLLLSIAIPGQIRYNGKDNRVTVCLYEKRASAAIRKGKSGPNGLSS